MPFATSDIGHKAEEYRDACLAFLRDLIAIPSESGHEERIVARIRHEMQRLGFDEVRVDGLGNIIGRIGSGERRVAFDAHIDTVGPGDLGQWKVDPHKGELRDGVLYGRGACDQEGGMAALCYAGRILKELGLAGDFTFYVVGSVMKEACCGLGWQYILRERVLSPEVVVLTEPTCLAIHRGQRGLVELEVTTRGTACDGGSPERGVSAIHRMGPILAALERLGERLAADPFLGKASVTASHISSSSPSPGSVADGCAIRVDRRMLPGETLAGVLAEVQALDEVRLAEAEVRPVDYDQRSYTGVVYPMQKLFPPWVLPEEHPLVAAGRRTFGSLFGGDPLLGKWSSSTNGVATLGTFGIPTIGFGPGSEAHAHTVDEQLPVEHLVRAMMFYAAFPSVYCGAA
jgi:putative selenium metabolism hydrolase